jgi:hypothetical protein
LGSRSSIWRDRTASIHLHRHRLLANAKSLFERLDEAASTRAVKLLAERFGGDLGSADSRAPAFIATVRVAMATQAVQKTGSADDATGQGAQESPPLRPLDEFHRDPRYGGDLHRADMAWARHAAAMGLSAGEIRAAIMQVRDLAKKGGAKRQREYAERTAGKAVRQAE